MLGYIIKTLKELVSNKKNIIVVVLGLLVVGGIALTAGNKEQHNIERKPDINIGVVDNDHSIYSSFILDYFKNTESFNKFANVKMDSEAAIKEQFQKGELLAYVVIPPNFADSLMVSENVTIDVVINTSNIMCSVLLKNMVDSYGTFITNVQVVATGLCRLGREQGMNRENVNKMNWETSLGLIQLALDRDAFFSKTEISSIPSTPVMVYYLWAVVSLLILLTAQICGNNHLKERQLGTYERLRIAGHSIRSITLVMLLLNSGLFILLFDLLLPILGGLLHCHIPFALYLYIDLCIIMANTVFLLISVLCKNNQQYAVISTFGLMLASIVGGVVIPISFLPEKFLSFSRFTPTYYMIQACINYCKNIESVPISVFAMITLLLSIVFYLLSCTLQERLRRNRREEVA